MIQTSQNNTAVEQIEAATLAHRFADILTAHNPVALRSILHPNYTHSTTVMSLPERKANLLDMSRIGNDEGGEGL